LYIIVLKIIKIKKRKIMSYELIGKIKSVSPEKKVSDTFKVREFVVTIDADGTYPQHILLQATNDKCDVLNTFAPGGDVKVSYNLRGREWTNPQGELKYFNSLDAWKIEVATSNSAPGAVASQNTANKIPANQVPVAPLSQEEEDDLPF
jgi:hypothetical protein